MKELIRQLVPGLKALTAGTKTTGHIPVAGTPIEMPFTLICGTKQGKDILITGGVHGGEYPCIETAIQLAKELDPKPTLYISFKKKQTFSLTSMAAISMSRWFLSLSIPTSVAKK